MKLIWRDNSEIKLQIYPTIHPTSTDLEANASRHRYTVEEDGGILYNGELIDPIELFKTFGQLIQGLVYAVEQSEVYKSQNSENKE